MVMSPGKKRRRKSKPRPFHLRTTFRDAAAELLTFPVAVKRTLTIDERRANLASAKQLRAYSIAAGIKLP